VFSAEFKFDERDGLFKILEVNARPWWYVDFAARCGVDVCRMAYRDALATRSSLSRPIRSDGAVSSRISIFKAGSASDGRGT